MLFCNVCGQQNQEQARFCGHCGQPLQAPGLAPAEQAKKPLTEESSARWFRQIPGFRSGTPWKQVTAVVGYTLLSLVILAGVVADNAGLVVLGVEALALVCLATNAWGIRAHLPGFRSRNKLKATGGWAAFLFFGFVVFIIVTPSPHEAPTPVTPSPSAEAPTTPTQQSPAPPHAPKDRAAPEKAPQLSTEPAPLPELARRRSYTHAQWMLGDLDQGDDVRGPVQQVLIEKTEFEFTLGEQGLVEGPRKPLFIVTYDTHGHKIAAFLPEDHAVICTWAYVYNSEKKVTEQQTYAATGVLVAKRVYTYDPQGRVTSLLSYSPDGVLWMKEGYAYDSTGKRTAKERYEYDCGGYRVQAEPAKPDCLDLVLKRVTEYDWARESAREQSVDPGGYTEELRVSFRFDTVGNWITQTTYNDSHRETLYRTITYAGEVQE